MKKLAKDLKKSEKIKLAEKVCRIETIEISEIGKQGKRKCRIELLTEKSEKLVIIRPEDYPFETV